jgi:hypothetical protein
MHEVIWDLRHEPPYEVPEEESGRFRGSPSGPKVLPGTYTVQLEAAEQTTSTEVEVRLDPRVEISEADLLARQEAMMSAYRLAKPAYEAGAAVRRLNTQLGDIGDLLEENENVPESIEEEVSVLRSELRELGQGIGRASGRGARSIERSTSRPTDAQLAEIERAWEQLPGLIEQLNEIISDRMAALYRQLDEHGVRPKVGDTIEVPTRP